MIDARTLLDAIPVPLVVADAEQRILEVNPAAEKLLARNAAGLRGLPLSTVLSRIESGPVSALRGDGTRIEVDLSLSSGGPLLVASLGGADRAASIGTLAAGLAHEINNPLVYVLLGLELIERETDRFPAGSSPSPDDWARIRSWCKDALEGAERVRTIVSDLRALSRHAQEGGVPLGARNVLESLQEPPEASGRRPRVLLIDDEPNLGFTLSTGLREHADLVSVRAGTEAVRLLLEDGGFDLILCDLNLPDLNGMDVFEQIARQRPQLRDRFVFTTGGAVTDRARDFLGQHRRLDKPFRLEQVEELLSRR